MLLEGTPACHPLPGLWPLHSQSPLLGLFSLSTPAASLASLPSPPGLLSALWKLTLFLQVSSEPSTNETILYF